MFKHRRALVLAQMLGAAVVINLATYAAWYIRYGLFANVQFGEGFFPQPYEPYVPLGIGLALVKRLVEAGADVVCLVRDWVPQSELVRTGSIETVKLVRGDVRDQTLVERTLGEYEVDTAFHLAAQTIVSIANRNPISTFESNIRGTWNLLEACRRSPRVPRAQVRGQFRHLLHHLE